ncbi:hypothetical protein VNO80_23028 [Phaseolus coccineus]|uniref:Uncharacterized protein n=1 Tax=Phaseolus coccineus TaxID=3886 RepID=A0AAN9QSA0_PHACN
MAESSTYSDANDQTKAILRRRLFKTSVEGEKHVCSEITSGGRIIYRGDSSNTMAMMRCDCQSRAVIGKDLGVTYEREQGVITEELEKMEVRDRKFRNVVGDEQGNYFKPISSSKVFDQAQANGHGLRFGKVQKEKLMDVLRLSLAANGELKTKISKKE